MTTRKNLHDFAADALKRSTRTAAYGEQYFKGGQNAG